MTVAEQRAPRGARIQQRDPCPFGTHSATSRSVLRQTSCDTHIRLTEFPPVVNSLYKSTSLRVTMVEKPIEVARGHS